MITRVTEGNVFNDIGLTPEEAAIATMKSILTVKIKEIVKERELSRRDLEKIFDIPQPRVSDLMTGKITKFSVESYVYYLSLLGEGIANIEFQHLKKAA